MQIVAQAGETYVSYFAEFGEYSPENSAITVSVYNDFTKRDKIFELPEGEEKFWGIEGYEDNLQPDMKYSISLKDGSKIIATAAFKTEKPAVERLEFSVDFVEVGDTVAFFRGDLGDYVPKDKYLTFKVFGSSGNVYLGNAEFTENEREVFGCIESLLPDTEYTVEIYDGNRVVARNSFRTAPAEEIYPIELWVGRDGDGLFYSADLGDYENESDMFTVYLYSDGELLDSGICEIYYDDDTMRYIEGEFWEADRYVGYVLEIYDGEKIIGRAVVSPEEEGVWFEIELTPGADDVFFVTYLEDYEPLDGQLTVVVYVYNNNYYLEEISRTQIRVENNEAAGTVSGLSPETFYIIELIDGDLIIAEDQFTTTEKVSIEFEVYVEVGADYIYYYSEISDYTPTAAYFTITILIEGYVVYTGDVAIETDDSSNRTISGEVTDLSPGTEYTLKLKDGDTVVAETTFITLTDDETETETTP